MNEQLILSVSDFVTVLNQTLDYAYPSVTIVGELSNFKVSKGKWVYFDLKDEQSSVRFFGTIYALPGPLEDGMKLQVTGVPRLHQQFGFSVTAQKIQPVGEGSIKKAFQLLQAKLQAEGLFDPERKRTLPYPPSRIGLVASGESAAYADFMKILAQRWGGVEIVHVDVQVQGEAAPAQIVTAIERLNLSEELDVIVVTRGGGSADDLQAFNAEQVIRAVAASRTPTMVAIGHEVDTCLAEMAADVRASTPSNAAELLVPDRASVNQGIDQEVARALQTITNQVNDRQQRVTHQMQFVDQRMRQYLDSLSTQLQSSILLLNSYDPRQILRRGYAAVKTGGNTVRSVADLNIGSAIDLRFTDGTAEATVIKVKKV